MKTIYRSAAALLLALLLACAACAADTLIVGGSIIGLELQLDGVTVVEFSASEPERAGLKRGDLIRKIDGRAVSTAAEVAEAVARSEGRLMRVTVQRGDKEKTLKVAAKQDGGVWRLGILVRDSITGVGTLTYCDPSDGSFGALGHGVCAASDGTLLPMRAGTVLASQVAHVSRGVPGTAGALQGAIRRGGICGTVTNNTSCGIFGTLSDTGKATLCGGECLPVADADEVHLGAATIRATVDGAQTQDYAVRITDIQPNDTRSRNLLIEVTDPTLLQKTGGIVQGM